MTSALHQVMQSATIELSREQLLSNGTLQRHYTTNSGGDIIKTTVVGIVRRVMRVDVNISLVILGPPDCSTSPVLRGMFYDMLHVLCDIPRKEAMHSDRPLRSQTHWCQEATAYTEGLIFVSISAQTRLGRVDWTTTPELADCRSQAREIPVTDALPPVIGVGGLLSLQVSMVREDTAGNTAQEPVLFDRVGDCAQTNIAN
ncbi:hypothetical protein B0H15DRAFT_795565 [Mycena belliarum]|uniref:Uncharacterized protein n=1 Tax=Mycena belliarum TaxID=1033014 RepID=A0AAD6UJN0_9AGAR|nr:hypothetical protein B0H15DRAFT_795565 [Mycena belliae]